MGEGGGEAHLTGYYVLDNLLLRLVIVLENCEYNLMTP